MHDHVQNLTIITPPSSEPVSLDEAKRHLRIESFDEDPDTDSDVSDLITECREWCENYVRRTFMPTTFCLTLDRFPERHCRHWGEFCHENDSKRIYLPNPPLISVNSISYMVNGVSQTLNSNSYNLLSGGLAQGYIEPVGAFPVVTPGIGAVTITYQSGFTVLPTVARRGIKLLLGHYWFNRKASSSYKLDEIPLGIRSVLSPLKWGSYV